MRNVLIPLTPVPSLFGDNAAVPAGGDGIGEVLATCIHRYDRLEAADAIGAYICSELGKQAIVEEIPFVPHFGQRSCRSRTADECKIQPVGLIFLAETIRLAKNHGS